MDDFELEKELSKNKLDKFIITEEIEKYKSKVANDILNGEGNEIKNYVSIKPMPKKMKKPFKVRISDFLNKLKIVFLGYDEYK